MIDTHCHLTFPDYEGRIEPVLEDAFAAGVTDVISISTTTWDCLDALRIAHERASRNVLNQARVWCTAGVHPLYSDVSDPKVVARSGEPETDGVKTHQWENLRHVARDNLCVAWGELGLDRHYPEPTFELQVRVLHEQLDFIESCNNRLREEGGIGRASGDGRLGLPIVIHCREAFDDLIPILKARPGLSPDRFVFHCFTGTLRDVRKILDFGAWVSFTGVLTYPNAAEVREAAGLVPRDRVMVETDAPFLPPIPHRGKRPCMPAWVVHTAQTLAQVQNLSFEAMHTQLNENTRRFFSLT